MLMGLLGAQLFKIMMRGCDICKRQESKPENQKNDYPKCDHFPQSYFENIRPHCFLTTKQLEVNHEQSFRPIFSSG